MPNRRHSSGFTMLEVLISIVILAFGLLGIAGLQAFALQNSHSAASRLLASTLANDIVDRIKANPTGVGLNAYNKKDLADYTAAGCDLTAASCTSPAEVAQNDLSVWQQRVGAALPNGQGIVCLDSTPDDGASAADPQCNGEGVVMYVVKIWWSDDRSSKAATIPTLRFWTPFNP